MKPIGKKVAASRSSNRALAQLRQLLAALSREARQEALEGLPAEAVNNSTASFLLCRVGLNLHSRYGRRSPLTCSRHHDVS